MIAQETRVSSNFKGEPQTMKKLMTLMLGLAFLTTTVAVSFAQDTGKSTESGKKKKGKKKSTDTTPHAVR